MTKEEAIKYLQQLYPNGGHCWLDEQRIEAIGMAVKALQEEPVSIWHDASEKSNEPEDVIIINPSDNTGEVLTRCINVYQGRIWAYTSVLLNLDNPCKIGKNLQEPISKELEEASKEWLRPQLDKSYVNYGEVKMMELTHFDGYAMLDAIEFGAKWGKNQAMAEIQAQSMALAHGCPEESESKDLGEYINELSKQFPEVSFAKLSRIAVRVAKWKGQQMMSKAIVREVKVDAGGYPYIDTTELYDYDKDMPLAKEGDKVKILVIKED